MIAIALIAASGVLLLLAASLPQATHYASEVIAACRSLFSLCISSTPLFATALMWGAILVMGGGFFYALVKNGAGLARSYLALRRLPTLDRGLGVVLIRDETLKLAFTHGLITPRIYVSRGLVDALSREELRSVLLHEVHHRRNRDPLRFFLIALARDSFFYLPAARHLYGRFLYLSEIEADDSVVARTRDRVGLASALLKLAKENVPMAAPQPAFITGTAEDRIRRLFGEERRRGVSLRVFLSSLALAAVLVSSVTIPAAFSMSPSSCNLEHCDLHGEEMGDSCKTHCEMSHHH